MSFTGSPHSPSTEKIDIKSLKRSYNSLKGWVRRKKIKISNFPVPNAIPIEYEGQFSRSKVWFTSPRGRADADLVRRYMNTKAKLQRLGKL